MNKLEGMSADEKMEAILKRLQEGEKDDEQGPRAMRSRRMAISHERKMEKGVDSR